MLAGGPFQGLVARQAFAASGRPTQADRGEGGYGDLRPITRTDNATRDTLTLLLPVGFDFVHFGLTGTTMTDGHLTPLGHDGMAAFPRPDGTTRLVRNHEDRNIALLSTPSGSAPSAMTSEEVVVRPPCRCGRSPTGAGCSRRTS